MSDISLRLLKPEDAAAAGEIVGKAHSSYLELGPYDGQWWLKNFFIPALRKGLEMGDIVIGGDSSSGLVAAYELPHFVKANGVLENSQNSFGWFATAEPNKGIGTAFMQKLGSIFAYCAYEAGVQQFVHREQATNSMNRNFFQRSGYKVVGTFNGNRYTYDYCVKMHPSSNHVLSSLEQEIAGRIVAQAQRLVV